MPTMQTIIYPTTDLAASTAVFTALLGVPPSANESYYVGFDVDGLHLGLNPHASGTAPVPHWHVADIAASTAELVAAGATVGDAAREVGGGRVVGTVIDAAGNVIGLIQDT